MKEIKRYNLEVISMHYAYGCMEESDEGDYVNYSDVEKLQARIKELESDEHINEIKAQGIKDFIKLETERLAQSENNSTFRAYGMLRRRLSGYLARLRAKHD